MSSAFLLGSGPWMKWSFGKGSHARCAFLEALPTQGCGDIGIAGTLLLTAVINCPITLDECMMYKIYCVSCLHLKKCVSYGLRSMISATPFVPEDEMPVNFHEHGNFPSRTSYPELDRVGGQSFLLTFVHETDPLGICRNVSAAPSGIKQVSRIRRQKMKQGQGRSFRLSESKLLQSHCWPGNLQHLNCIHICHENTTENWRLSAGEPSKRGKTASTNQIQQLICHLRTFSVPQV